MVVLCKRVKHCCVTLRRSHNNGSVGLVAQSLTGFKLSATSANIIVVPCKRTQHVGLNNVCCWPTMLRPFAWDLNKSLTGFKQNATSANIVVVPCKRTQHVEYNNVAWCWPAMLHLFAGAF